ncbi:MAG: RNA polymerase-binding protein DksA [Deltaproteobacteria bacterium]|nr:MAG: RNA polymerase-binding protein DksA [Deltaproteobacteria bacterium]
MNDNNLEMLRQKLIQMKADIYQDVESTLNEMVSQTGNIPDPNDRATIESDRSFELRIRDRERKLLEKIDQALARIKEGSYGTCEGCGEAINVKRLEARPVASFCIACKTRQEQKEKEQGR